MIPLFDEKGDVMWSQLGKLVLHAAIGGAAAGFGSVGVGATNKQAGMAALLSAITSVASLFAKPPASDPAPPAK